MDKKKKNKPQRVQKMVVRPSHPNYKDLDECTHACKDLYNYALYRIRACFIYWWKAKSGENFPNYEQIAPVLEDLADKVDAYNQKRLSEWPDKCVKALKKGKEIPEIPYFKPLGIHHLYPNYEFMDFYCKNSSEYRALLASMAQQVLRKLDKAWVSFFVAIKDWNENPSKYTGKPNLPNYLPKDGHFEAIIPKAPKLSEREISIPVKNSKNRRNLPNKTVIQKGFYLPDAVGGIFVPFDKPNKVAQIRIVPKLNHFVIEVVYDVEEVPQMEDNGITVSADLGLNNFVALANNIGLEPLLISGKKIKSINQFYNKSVAMLRAKIMSDLANEHKNKHPHQKYQTPKGCTSNMIKAVTVKRNAQVDDFIHKASKAVIDYALRCNATTIIIGKNVGWKDEINLGSRTNQAFVCLPHTRFIEKVQYKALAVGIKVILTEESYTSKTSSLDGELPTKEVSDHHKETAHARGLRKTRRVKRGLFISNQGILINADINAAFQIMRKVVKIERFSPDAITPRKIDVFKQNVENFYKVA